ncbi:MAG: bactofilin family protein [Lysobacteraceae bacterium]
MAIFNQSGSSKKDAETPSFAAREPAAPPPANTDFAPATFPRTGATAAATAPAPATKESLIAADLTIEGKIEGAGHVRIAGRFKGEVNVQGDLSLERGAKINGGVRAKKVVVAGELEGNIESAARVELLETAVLVGDLKAGTLTVAAGAKVRGHVDCGWETTGAPKPDARADAAEG